MGEILRGQVALRGAGIPGGARAKNLFQAVALTMLMVFQSALSQSDAPVHEVVWNFMPPPSFPTSEVVEGVDGSFYGTTSSGGLQGFGTLFKLTGTVRTTLLEFTGTEGGAKGAQASGRLLLGKDGNFYGVTANGGAKNFGTIFKVTPAGLLTTLVEFSGIEGSALGRSPYGGLIEGTDGNFYGTTNSGGANSNAGTVFKLTPGGAFTTLVSFTGSGSPFSALTQGSDGNIYGTTFFGGAKKCGTVFKVTPKGVLTTLVEFSANGAINKGGNPLGALVEGSDGNFYGTTSCNKTAEVGVLLDGTVFKMTPAGVLTTLVEFSGNGPVNKGSHPYSTLVAGNDGSFYGTTNLGGANGKGTLFKMTSAGVLTTLTHFTGKGVENRGSAPSSVIKGSDGNLYGTTRNGGVEDSGTVFKVTPTGLLGTLSEFGGNQGEHPQSALLSGNDGNYYGTTQSGGTDKLGTIFRIIPGAPLVTLVSFTGNGGNSKGKSPSAELIYGSDGSFYGTTSAGGASDRGTIFKMSSEGILTTLVEFTGNGFTNRGGEPKAALVEGSDGSFYGTTYAGGERNLGTVFKMSPTGALTTLAEFTSNAPENKGAYPIGRLVRGTDGSFYGTTSAGGSTASYSIGNGTVFKITQEGVLTTLVDFSDTAARSPYAGLILTGDGSFYGSTLGGGALGRGTLFKMTPAGQVSVLAKFTGGAPIEGVAPQGELVEANDGRFYGTTTGGGREGTLFQVTAGGAFKSLVDFAGNTGDHPGALPASALITGLDGNLYGTTLNGGRGGLGTIYRIRLGPVALPQAGSVILSASVNPHGQETSAFFEYGATADLGSQTPVQSLGSGLTGVEVTATLNGLKPHALRYYRLVTLSGGISTIGETHSFTVANNLPVISNDTIFCAGMPVTAEVLANDTDADGDPVMLLGATNGHQGTVAISGDKQSIIYTPAAGFSGADSFTYSATDGYGSAQGTVTVTVGAPFVTALLATHTALVGEPETTLIRSFGVPSISSDGVILVKATLSTKAGIKGAIIGGTPPRIVIRQGQPAPDPNGSLSESRVFIGFSDPVCDAFGHVAFVAKVLDGKRIRTGLWSDASGVLGEIALIGGEVPGIAGAYFKSINSFAISESGQLFYTAILNGVGITAVNDMSLWVANPAGNFLLLRDGDPFEGYKVGSFATLSAVPGSLGQGRSFYDDAVIARIIFTENTELIAAFRAESVFDLINATGQPPEGLVQENTIGGFGIPSLSSEGKAAYLARFVPGAGDATSLNDQVIVADMKSGICVQVAREGDPAPAADGARFAALSDPVYSAQSGSAFLARLIGTGVTGKNNSGIWWKSSAGLNLLARTGGEAAGIAGARWSAFTSLALPDKSGPVFVAKLEPGATRFAGRVNASNNIGVWALNSAGALELVLRTGDRVQAGGKLRKISLLTFLGPVSGSPGQGRSYNDAHELVFRATFTDHTQAILRARVP
ncbi:MAG: 3-carboxymuconate cyclase [Chthoniobacteraceae bacterium]|nr:3-carboxymuconate cyclase [Chthoniobacteraceae bacterium]